MRLSPALLRPLAAIFVALLAGCATQTVDNTGTIPGPPPTWTVPPGSGPALTPITFAQIPGWNTDHTADALATFIAGCARMTGRSLGGQGQAAALGGASRQWQAACAAAAQTPPSDTEARAFFEAMMQPYGVSSDGTAEGLFTGYYEPEAMGSRTPGGRFRTPIYRRPPGLVSGKPFLARAEIARGALANKHLELLWLADPIDAFFLEIQGSGRVLLPDGSTVRLNYDGQNGRGYVPIGRVLVDRGEMTLPQVSMQSIRAWLETHPDQARNVMDQNPSYVFFRETNGVSADTGAPGALGVPLSPMRSIAVDKGFIPLGAPVWINTRDALDGSPFRHLMVAQDLGGAIRGPIRADIFFGWGKDATERAGRMRQQGTEIVLLPRGS